MTVPIQPSAAVPCRKRLLYLAYAFRPSQSVSSVRSWNTAKHLSRLGWRVTVVTPRVHYWARKEDPQLVEAQLAVLGINRILTSLPFAAIDGHNVKAATKGPRRLLEGAGRRLLQAARLRIGLSWVPAVLSACRFLGHNTVDCILATGAPFASFCAARALSRRIGATYYLDYRDLWTTNNPHAQLGSPLARFLERRCISGATGIAVVSAEVGEALDGAFGVRSKTHVITNGFDPDECAAVKPATFGHKAIVYAGAFYPPKRTIEPMAEALVALKQDSALSLPAWRFHYYGTDSEYVRQAFAQRGLLDSLADHGFADRNVVLSAIRGSSVCVVISSILGKGSLADRGIITGKVFEPLGLGSPILAICPEGSALDRVVGEQGACIRGDDVGALKDFLERALRERIAPSSAREQYSWAQLSRRFDAMLGSGPGH